MEEENNNEIMSPNLDAQKEQRNIKLIAGGAVLAVLVAWRVWVAIGSAENNTVVEKEKIRIFKNDDMVQTKFVGEIAPEISAQKSELLQMKKQQAEQLKQLEDMKKMMEQKTENQSEQKAKKGVDFKYSDSNQKDDDSYPLPFQNFQNTNSQAAIAQKPAEKTIKIENIQDSMVFDIKKNDDNGTDDKNISRGKKNITLAPGVLIKARLISGVRAPTLTKAVHEPQPVFLKVTDLAILPNRGKLNIKECMVKGEAKGDLATETVHIRTNFLSCTTNDGEVLVSKLSASVFGTSGTNGIGGVVVSKQGALLGRSLIAGFVEGFAKSGSSQYQSVLTTTTGTLTTNNGMSGDEMLKSGAYGGIAKAGTEMSKFYMDMVKQIEPSIEIKPNIDVDIMVTDVSTIEFKKEGVR
ncbi:MAG: TraB/VirB10 family protein [Sulfurimonas sp.]|jgi:conjugal transfer pilus assembly protein TraB|uniref:TraB/VirB10 family protein n=1 Tax=Sulfurimonas sp. TaxID=2022749 RepID=UPI003569A5B9